MKLYQVSIKNNNVKKYDELQFDGKEYFSFEYTKEKGKMTQIGVVVSNATGVVVKQFDNIVARLKLDDVTQIWYHQSSQWVDGKYDQRTDSIFGINAGGSFEVIAFDNLDKEIDKVVVNITPGTMSIEEYKQMQQEVRRLFEVFSYNREQANNVLLKRIQLPLYHQEKFKGILYKFVSCFNEIVRNPEQRLIRSEKKINIHQVKKWTPSIIIENELKKTGKVTAIINEKSTDIVEHRMIRFMLEEFLRRIEMEQIAEHGYYQQLLNELGQLKEMVENVSDKSIRQNFTNLIQVIEPDIKVLEDRFTIWNKLKVDIDELLENPLMQIESISVEGTHLFRMHPLYSEVYLIFMEYEKLSPIFTNTFRLFVQSILKSPTLYEVWILLKIIEHLSKWGLDTGKFIEEVKGKHLNATTISEYRQVFVLRDGLFEVEIAYDFPIGKKEYRPDFTIGFRKQKEEKWIVHSLDAKYKNYSLIENDYSGLEKDLKGSGMKYLDGLYSEDTSRVLKTATLIHPDIKSINWNVKNNSINIENKQHLLAHFHFTPNQNLNLDIYFKRILHENNSFSSCCPKCMKIAIGEKSNKRTYGDIRTWKTTYKCEECRELWVANYCGSCPKNTLKTEVKGLVFYHPRPLYKYLSNNYNVQVKEDWDVHCPSCYSPYNRKKFKPKSILEGNLMEPHI